jgi:hypothetical protein
LDAGAKRWRAAGPRIAPRRFESIPLSPPEIGKGPAGPLSYFRGGEGRRAPGSTKRESVLDAGAKRWRAAGPRIAPRRFESIPLFPPLK